MLNTRINLPLSSIRAYCRAHPILRLSVFGSALRDDFTPESDLDLLVEFTPDARITYFDMHNIQQALAKMIGHKVDLRTPQELSPYFVDDVRARAELIYERQG